MDTAIGPYTVDLMQVDRTGRPLRFFAPLPCTQVLCINVFAQDILSDENAYIFPPFVLIGPLLKYGYVHNDAPFPSWPLTFAQESFGGRWFNKVL